MIADRCEINRQIRADNKMLRELKAKVVKLAEAVEKSIPIIAETLEAIRNHMIFTLCHLLHNEMQKEVIHDWMNHFNPILNKYNTVKKIAVCELYVLTDSVGVGSSTKEVFFCSIDSKQNSRTCLSR